MDKDGLDEWRLSEKAALEAEEVVRSNIGKRSPMLRDLKAKAARLRTDADTLLARHAKGEPRLPDDTAGSLASSLASHVAAWRRAEKRAEIAQEQLVAAFNRYVEDAGPLPPIQWENDVAMLRLESTNRLEHVYAEAKRLRSPSPEDFRRSLPGSFGEL